MGAGNPVPSRGLRGAGRERGPTPTQSQTQPLPYCPKGTGTRAALSPKVPIGPGNQGQSCSVIPPPPPQRKSRPSALTNPTEPSLGVCGGNALQTRGLGDTPMVSPSPLKWGPPRLQNTFWLEADMLAETETQTRRTRVEARSWGWGAPGIGGNLPPPPCPPPPTGFRPRAFPKRLYVAMADSAQPWSAQVPSVPSSLAVG